MNYAFEAIGIWPINSHPFKEKHKVDRGDDASIKRTSENLGETLLRSLCAVYPEYPEKHSKAAKVS